MTRTNTKLLPRSLVWCLLALGAAAFCRAASQPLAGEGADALMRRAAEAEKASRTNEAVAAYTRLLQRDPSFENVVGPRLVDLLTGSGQASEALSWAARVARRHPEPAAYLAGVFSRLGQGKEAELLLSQTLASERDARRRTRLLWQLADAQESQGDRAAAALTLARARDGAPDEALQATTAQRLDALRARTQAARPERAAAPQPTAGREKP